MSRRVARFGLSLLVITCLKATNMEYSQAQDNNLNDYCSKDSSIGELVSVENDVEIVSSINSQGRNFTKTVSVDSSQENRYVCDGDEIIVGSNSRTSLYMKEPKAVIRLDENSIFQIKSTHAPDYNRTPSNDINPELTSFSDAIKFCQETINRTWLNLKQGAIHLFTTEPQRLNINSDYMNASVEGTEFVLRVDSSRADVSVIDGVVGVCNNDGNEVLLKGQRATAEKDAAPVKVRPLNAVQWALYYPILGKNESTSKEALQAYDLANKGQISEAIRILNNLDIDAYSLALRSTIAVANNNLDDAAIMAEQALKLDNESASAWMAKSYVEQANFDLPQAQVSVENADQYSPEDAIVMARLAELKLSNDDKKGAQETAVHAKAVNPDISRTHTVLGFIQLSQFEVDVAKKSFIIAIDLDESDPLPRLGLGLANIRQNDIEQGKKNIEIAISLDPQNSLLRSYFAKTYIELTNDFSATDQLNLAKQFDENDPTPYYYDAILQQLNNRPIQALKLIETSLEKNNYRSVYRSKFGVKDDSIQRLSQKSKINNDIGFDRLSLQDGLRVNNRDPNNATGLKLLSDSFSFLPRHEIAQSSALFQSRINQSVSKRSLQTFLADKTFLNQPDFGTFDPSYNEFDSLFNRNGFSFSGSALAGSNSLFGEEIIVSNLTDKSSIAANQFHYQSDGAFKNNDIEKDSQSLFIENKAGDDLNIQYLFDRTEQENGDLAVFANSQNRFLALREEEKLERHRLSAKYKHNKSRSTYFTGAYQDGSFDLSTSGLDINGDTNSRLFEIKHSITNVKNNHLDIGAAYYFTNKNTNLNFLGTEGFLKEEIKDWSVFSYKKFVFDDNKYFTFGVNYNNFQDEFNGVKESNYNPKFGFEWETDSQYFRVVALRSQKRQLIDDQTIEPFLVAGFNQYYDDFVDGARADQFGIGYDRKLNSNLYFGGEFQYRDVNLPKKFFDENSESPTFFSDTTEQISFFTYLYYLYNENVSASLEYYYYDLKNIDPSLTFDLIKENSTNVLNFKINYFKNRHEIITSVNFISQDGEYINVDTDEIEHIKDDFYVFNTQYSYKFRKPNLLLTLGINNIFDKKFSYQDIDLENPRFSPERTIFFRLSVSF